MLTRIAVFPVRLKNEMYWTQNFEQIHVGH